VRVMIGRAILDTVLELDDIVLYYVFFKMCI
jgi:hypothetical protein